ncbi:MAG: BF3164 family lipoprotein, partial [Phocaeicola sp.]|nr:BF3164 family lipoprotein [Phocaeicola sp.]
RISSPDSVWVLDSNRCQITRWRISNGNAERVEEIPLDDRLIRTLDFCKTADGFLVTDYTGNYRYHVLDQCGKIIQSVGHVPSEKQGRHLPDRGSKLYTFTLTGLPVKCYELSKPVCGICVDEVQKSFFATDVFTDKLITEFDLKN